jgi:hypothetical protein
MWKLPGQTGKYGIEDIMVIHVTEIVSFCLDPADFTRQEHSIHQVLDTGTVALKHRVGTDAGYIETTDNLNLVVKFECNANKGNESGIRNFQSPSAI